jgi:uncharacterized protein (DUF697 family)
MMPTEFGEAEYGPSQYGSNGRRRRGRLSRESEAEGHRSGNGSSEQQFLPLIPIIGSLLGGLLKETEAEASGEYAEYGEGEYQESAYQESAYQEAGYGEAEYGEAEYGPAEYGEAEQEEAEYGESEYGESEYGQAEQGEAEQQFLGGLFRKVLGGALEQGGPALSPAHEAALAGRLLEVGNEAELENFLGDVVNVVGRGLRAARDFAGSPAGQAVIQAVKPLAKTALPWVGGAIGSAIAPGIGTAAGRALGSAASAMFEMEVGELSSEEAEYELARRVVQLTSAAARSAIQAPPDQHPQAVGEFSVFRAARRFAPGFYRRGLSGIRPYAHRYGGGYRGGYRGGYGRRPYRYGGWYGRQGRFGPYGRYGGGRYGPNYGGQPDAQAAAPAPDAGPAPEEPPGPPRPGFRWVAVPIGGQPPAEPPPPGAGGPPPGPDAAGPPAQGEFSGPGGDGGGQWVRRGHKIIVMGA